MHECLPTFMHVYHTCTWSSRPEEGVGHLRTGATDNCEPNLGPLPEKQVLLTTEGSFQPPLYFSCQKSFVEWIVIEAIKFKMLSPFLTTDASQNIVL